MDMKFVFVLLAVYCTCQSEALYSKSKKDVLLEKLRELVKPESRAEPWARKQHQCSYFGQSGFYCNNGPYAEEDCMPFEYECDGFVDCAEADDEHDGCPACPEFTCPTLGIGFERCYHVGQRCDRYRIEDCADGSDEIGCTRGVGTLLPAANGRK